MKRYVYIKRISFVSMKGERLEKRFRPLDIRCCIRRRGFNADPAKFISGVSGDWGSYYKSNQRWKTGGLLN